MKKIFTFFLILFVSSSFAQIPQTGTWRAEIAMQQQILPFKIEIEKNIWYLVNGEEKIKLDKFQQKGDSILIPMHIFDASIIAKVENKKLIQGFYYKHHTKSEYKLPFRAKYGFEQRFEGKTKKTQDFSGKWEVTFQKTDGKTYKALGIFEQNDTKITGTFLTGSGDYRYLAGNTFGNQFKISAFDGSHLFIFESEIKEDTLKGQFWSGKGGYRTFKAFRNPDMLTPERETTLKKDSPSFTFSFPDLNQNLVSPHDKKYKGKARIIQILGSWCPNCMDETRFLSKWYKENKDRGIEIIGIAFESSAKFEDAKKRLEILKERFGIEYTLLYGGQIGELKEKFAMLEGISVFPTTIFMDKEGEVQEIHTGFSGPSTGVYYEKFIEKFKKTTDKLIN